MFIYIYTHIDYTIIYIYIHILTMNSKSMWTEGMQQLSQYIARKDIKRQAEQIRTTPPRVHTEEHKTLYTNKSPKQNERRKQMLEHWRTLEKQNLEQTRLRSSESQPASECGVQLHSLFHLRHCMASCMKRRRFSLRGKWTILKPGTMLAEFVSRWVTQDRLLNLLTTWEKYGNELMFLLTRLQRWCLQFPSHSFAVTLQGSHSHLWCSTTMPA